MIANFVVFLPNKKKDDARDRMQQHERPRMNYYVFIIDEINRGEISKCSENYFSIYPGYWRKSSELTAQYDNIQDSPNERFYVPENIYIISTMNDIDHSVDTFDFAM